MGKICSSSRIVKSKAYWTDSKNANKILIQGYHSDDMKPNIKLEFTIENIEKKHQYQIQVIFSDQSSFETEKVLTHQQVIKFNTNYKGNYFFEKQQLIKIYLFRDEIEYGSINSSLGKIIVSKGSVFEGKINKNIIIKISAKGISDDTSYVVCKFSADSSQSFYDAKNKISFLIRSELNKIYSSESIDGRGRFLNANIPKDLLEKGFTVSFLDSFQETIICKDENIKQFCKNNKDIYLEFIANNNRIKIFNRSTLYKEVNFIDYITTGVRIKFSIGIDYTGSNLHPNDPKYE